MTSTKKYYWLRLKEDFFDDDTIQFIEEQENGIYYSNFYLKLCLKSIRTEGKLMRLIGSTLIPYDIKSLAKLTGVNVDTVAVAMKMFEAIGLVERLETGEIYLSQINEMIGSETDKAVIMRRKRAQEKLIIGDAAPLIGNNVTNESNIVTEPLPKCYTEIEKEIDKEIRDREQRKDIETDDMLGAETAPSPNPQDSPVISLPLNDKTDYPITHSDINEWSVLYPAVNIMQELRKMRGWLDANPTRKKTQKGIRRFINSWLSREQDKPHIQSVQKAESLQRNSNPFLDMLKEEEGQNG